jgi:hypothetical protein
MRQSKRRKRGITAWLVTWEHIGDHAKPLTSIAAVLNPRWSSERVREIVELVYVNSQYSPRNESLMQKTRASIPIPPSSTDYAGSVVRADILWAQPVLVCARGQ